MGPTLESKGKAEAAMEVPDSKESKIASQGLEDKIVDCASNCEDKMFDIEPFPVEQTTITDISHDVEINITDCTNDSDIGPVESKSEDLTENSSSFGDTVSGTENDSLLDADEVESQFCYGNAVESTYDGYNEAFQMRKKKLTVHWRKFIRPLMWRCKWIELQVKELQSQALKYDRELAKYDERKQLEYKKLLTEGFDVKSFPFLSQIQRSEVVKRKKRKRIEETADIAPYMSNHSLFSYCDRKRSVTGVASVEDKCGGQDGSKRMIDDFGTTQGWSSFDLEIGDNSLGHILLKIDTLHEQVRKLRNKIDKVVTKNPTKCSSINNLISHAPYDAPVSSEQNPTYPGNGNSLPVGSRYAASEHLPECKLGDMLSPENAGSGHRHLTLFPDIMESKEQIGGYFNNTEDGILIHNQAAKEELRDFENVRGQLIKLPQTPMKEQKAVPAVGVSGVKSLSETIEPNVQSKVKALSTINSNFPRNTRNGGRRRKPPQTPMKEQTAVPAVGVSGVKLLSETIEPNVQSKVKSLSTINSNFPRNTRNGGKRRKLPQSPMKEQKAVPAVRVAGVKLLSETIEPNVQSKVKSFSTFNSNFPRNTRNGGRRKNVWCKWNTFG